MAKYAIIKSFYASEAWQLFRLLLINQRGNTCQKCGKLIPVAKDIIGHHLIELTPENVQDYSISLNPDLVELICPDCHNKIHHRFGYRPAKNVCIVFGPPLAGKKSYVKAQMDRGDMVVDMDQLYAAVTMLPYYDKPDSLLSNVRAIHNTLIDNIKTRYGKWNTAWIIGGYADRYKREKLADELGAELIFCNVSKGECLRRLEFDQDRQYRRDEWAGYIRKWFDEYVA